MIDGAPRVAPDDEAIARLAAVAERGVHDPEHSPFSSGWTDHPAHVHENWRLCQVNWPIWLLKSGATRLLTSERAESLYKLSKRCPGAREQACPHPEAAIF